MSLHRKKSLNDLMGNVATDEHTLKRTLGRGSLIALGIGAIIGAGLFVRTAAAAGEHAGAAVTLSFIVAAVGCAFAGLCYAEFASIIPIAGSAYTYAYATMGELVAWVIGWALVLEYALGAATVSIAWSEYLNKLLADFNVFGDHKGLAYEWCHSPFEFIKDTATGVETSGIINLPALFILALLTLLLIRGTQQSAIVNSVIVVLKVSIVIIFIALGWGFIDAANHTPLMIPADMHDVIQQNGEPFSYKDFWNHGFGGVIAGAGVVFFAFIGFDAVSTAAQEAKNPQKDMPFGILGSLAICTVLYILFSYVLTGVAPFTDFISSGKEASVSFAITKYMAEYTWLAKLITIAILAGFSSVILVMLMGQSRVFYTMSKDGLLPKAFSKLGKYQTPYKSNRMLFLFVGFFAAFIPGDVAGDLTSIGTLFAFILVCAGVLILRKTDPQLKRPFKTPLVPFVPIAGILVCTLMIVGLDIKTQIGSISWMLIGLDIYMLYSLKNSKLHHKAANFSIKPLFNTGIVLSILLAGLAVTHHLLLKRDALGNLLKADDDDTVLLSISLSIAAIHLILFGVKSMMKPAIK